MVNLYSAPEPPKKELSLFDWLACCVEKSDSAQDYRLRPKEELIMGQLQQEVCTPYNSEAAEHEALLAQYFKAAAPRLAQRATLPTGRRDARWKLLGFQDEDPRTDFRGGGLLSLKCLLWMAELDAQRVAQLTQESNGNGTLEPEFWYPFAAAVINVSFELAQWLMLDHRRSSRQVQAEDVCNGFEYRRFAELSVIEPETYLILCAAAVTAMHEEWCTKHYSVLEFRKCVKVALKRVSIFLAQSTKEPAEKLLARLRQTWALPLGYTAGLALGLEFYHSDVLFTEVFGASSAGGLAQLDIFADQKKCQTLTLEGTMMAVCHASEGRILVAAETSVTCLTPIPFQQQVEQLLAQVRTSEALDLINATYGPEDPERQVQLEKCHKLAGWALFADLQFLKAFQHFMYCSGFRIEEVLLYWRRYLPEDWEATCRPASDGGSASVPEVGELVRQKLLERQQAGEAAVSANVGLANAADALGVGTCGACAMRLACMGKAAAAETKTPPKKRDSSTIKKDIKDGGIGHAQFIIENTGKITDHYQMDKKKLGEGSYGSVCKATNISTKAIRAVKTIAKTQMKNIERFKQEIAIMKMMDHPNIIKLYESFEDLRNIYLVMELCAGGELFDRIIESGHFSEVQAAILMQQIIRAIYYMHENHIAHRDLKPENFLFMTKDPIEKNFLKIIDFGLSCKFTPDQALTTKAGTPYYVAPQVLAGKYDQQCDIWSCGVIMYVLLCGYPPFFGESDADVLAKVRLGNFNFNPADWKNVSDDAKSLIRWMLKMNPRDRYTAEQALNHEWIKNKAPRAAAVPLRSNFVDNLRGFQSQNKLKKAALHIIAGQLNEDEIKKLRDVFTSLDKNGDGLLTHAELKDGMAKAGLKEIPPDLAAIMDGVDADGSGVIDYTEFLAATLDRQQYMKEDVCWAAFRVFDRNGDGHISTTELKQVLSSSEVEDALGTKAIADLMVEVDSNGDGMIDFEEFMTMMRGR
ncbi:unnamed protein product [Effrenium voratum]|nr:unnamed protein product [Effrenium voratum]